MMNLTYKSFEELTKTELYEILRARAQIFIVEMGMNCQDLDREDYESRHYFYQQNGKVTAYLRAFLKDGKVKIGRVLTAQHGIGLGRKFFTEALAQIKSDFPDKKLTLHSQKQVTGFYEKFGFKAVSKPFIEEGVEHIKMEL